MSLILRSILASISNFFPSAVFYTNTSSRVVSLTIDDVGGADTLQFLDVIDKFNQNITSENERIRATFFVITDYLDHSLTILDEILDRGHDRASILQRWDARSVATNAWILRQICFSFHDSLRYLSTNQQSVFYKQVSMPIYFSRLNFSLAWWDRRKIKKYSRGS